MTSKNDQIQLSRFREFQFNLKRGKGHLFHYWRNRFVYWSLFPKWNILPAFPDHVDIELSTVCNMKCPMCYTLTDDYLMNVKQQLMSYELFQKIINECSGHRIFSIRLSLRGEPFLHPDIIKIARYAKESNIKEVSSLTNMLSLTPDMFEELVKMRFDWLTISFDGLGETYEEIRKPAKFDEAYRKIKEFKKIKDRYKSVKPVIKVQTIWPAIEDDPEAFYNAMEPYADLVVSNPLSENFGNVKYEYVDTLMCPVLYQRIVVTPSGEVILCANDDYSKVIVGDVNKSSLQDIWLGDKMNEIRKIHKNFGGYKNIDCCRECYTARKTRQHEENISGKKVKIIEFAGKAI